MIIALYGASCVGKSTIAMQLSSEADVPIRKCGDVVRAFAAEKGIAPEELSLEDHRKIDAESVEWVLHNSSSGIIEGRFLDCVLAGVSSDVHLVLVTAEPQVRACRWEERRPGVDGHSEVVRQDDADEKFRAWAYLDAEQLESRSTVDTTEEASEWPDLLELLLESH